MKLPGIHFATLSDYTAHNAMHRSRCYGRGYASAVTQGKEALTPWGAACPHLKRISHCSVLVAPHPCSRRKAKKRSGPLGYTTAGDREFLAYSHASGQSCTAAPAPLRYAALVSCCASWLFPCSPVVP